MKLLLDFLPIILFFVTFQYAEGHQDWAAAFASQHMGFLVSGGQVSPLIAPVILATAVVIVATLAQVLFLKLRGRRVDLMLWISLALVVVLGGATIWLQSEAFIKWKPTVLYWTMAVVFATSELLLRKNLLRALLGEQMQLPAPVWRRLNWAWVAFFVVMGALNIWVAYQFSTPTWVKFKLFGGIGLMVVFTLGQGMYLGRHLQDESPPKEKP